MTNLTSCFTGSCLIIRCSSVPLSLKLTVSTGSTWFSLARNQFCFPLLVFANFFFLCAVDSPKFCILMTALLHLFALNFLSTYFSGLLFLSSLTLLHPPTQNVGCVANRSVSRQWTCTSIGYLLFQKPCDTYLKDLVQISLDDTHCARKASAFNNMRVGHEDYSSALRVYTCTVVCISMGMIILHFMRLRK